MIKNRIDFGVKCAGEKADLSDEFITKSQLVAGSNITLDALPNNDIEFNVHNSSNSSIPHGLPGQTLRYVSTDTLEATSIIKVKTDGSNDIDITADSFRIKDYKKVTVLLAASQDRTTRNQMVRFLDTMALFIRNDTRGESYISFLEEIIVLYDRNQTNSTSILSLSHLDESHDLPVVADINGKLKLGYSNKFVEVITANTNIPINRFVNYDGTLGNINAGKCMGSSITSANDTELVSLVISGIAYIELAQEVQAGNAISTDIQGKGIVALQGYTINARACIGGISGQTIKVIIVS